MIILYIILVIVCLTAYLYANWHNGNDAGLAEIFGMMTVAVVPVLNVVVACVVMLKLINGPIIKGRQNLINGPIIKGRQK